MSSLPPIDADQFTVSGHCGDQAVGGQCRNVELIDQPSVIWINGGARSKNKMAYS